MSISQAMRGKIERFLRQSICDDTSSKLCLLEVHHCPQGQRPSLLWPRQFDEEDGGLQLTYVDNLLNELVQRITDDASGMGGVQRYQITAYDGEGTSMGRHMIRVAGYDESLDAFGECEDASARGMISMQMRHNEALVKSTHVVFGQVMTMMQRQLSKTQDWNEKLLQERREAFEVVEQAHSKAHKRELKMLKAADTHEFKGRLMDKADLLLPAVVNKLVGKSVIPVKATPQQDTLKELVHSLQPQQMEMILSSGIFTQEQVIALMTLINQFQAEASDDDMSPKDSSSGGTNGAN